MCPAFFFFSFEYIYVYIYIYFFGEEAFYCIYYLFLIFYFPLSRNFFRPGGGRPGGGRPGGGGKYYFF